MTKCLKAIKITVFYAFLLLLCVYLLFPFFVMITRSLMEIEEVAAVPAVVFPKGFYLGNYKEAFASDFVTGLGNTLLVMVIRVTGIVFSSYICAFSFARIKFRGKNILFSTAMVTIMLPGIVSMMPLYILYHKIGFLNTLYPLWVPAMFGGGMSVIFLERQFIKTVPKSLDEAALMDGANYLHICFQIILPIVSPVLVFTAVGSAIGVWNDFMGPLTYISDAYPEKYTLAVTIFNRFRGASSVHSAKPNVQAALCVIMMLPPLAAFIVFNKSMINGISIGSGIKG